MQDETVKRNLPFRHEVIGETGFVACPQACVGDAARVVEARLWVDTAAGGMVEGVDRALVSGAAPHWIN